MNKTVLAIIMCSMFALPASAATVEARFAAAAGTGRTLIVRRRRGGVTGNERQSSSCRRPPAGDVRTANRGGKPHPDRESMTRAILR